MNRQSVKRAMLLGLLAVSASALAASQGEDVQPAVQTSAGAWAKPGNAPQVAPPADPGAPDASGVPAIPVPSAAARGPVMGAAPSLGRHRATRRVQAHAQTAQTAQTDAGPTHEASAAHNADSIQLGTTQISGNRELPKLMYIVPWQRPQLGAVTGRPPNSLVDEALTPVDRAVFERQNRYYAALAAASAPPAAAARAPERQAGRQDEK